MTLYSSIDTETAELVTVMYGTNYIELGECPKQDGYADCGCFAIAVCVALASQQPIGPFMREHLIACFENLLFSVFSIVFHLLIIIIVLI